MTKTSFSSFPAEVFEEIFLHLNTIELVKLELVCKSWKEFIRTCSALWKRCDYLDSQPKICSTKVAKVIQLHRERSQEQIEKDENEIKKEETVENGNLDSISVPIYLDAVVDEEVVKIMQVVKASNVKKLWIVIAKQSPFKRNDGFKYKVTLERVKKVVHFVRFSLLKCDRLISLRLVSTMDVNVEQLNQNNLAENPLYKCKLNDIFISGISYNTFLPQEMYRTILSKAKVVELTFGLGKDMVFESKAWEIIEIAEDTLEICRFDYQLNKKDEIDNSFTPKIISFPQLKELTIDVFATVDGPKRSRWQYSPICPNLKLLRVLDQTPKWIFEHLISNSITYLHVELYPHHAKAILQGLKRCTKLENLSLGYMPGYDSYISESNDTEFMNKSDLTFNMLSFTTATLPLRELCLLGFKLNGLTQFLKKRKECQFSSNVEIVKMVSCQDDHQGTIEWIKENIEKVEIINNYSKEQIMIGKEINGRNQFEWQESLPPPFGIEALHLPPSQQDCTSQIQ